MTETLFNPFNLVYLLVIGAVALVASMALHPRRDARTLTRGFGVSWSINSYNVVFLAFALVLHWRPLSFLRACRDGVDAVWGIILQFPFYAGFFDSCRTPRSARGSPPSSPSLPASARTRSSCTCTQDS